MQPTATQKETLPFKCRMLCISLAGASLLLILIFLLNYLDYISTVTAIWAATGVLITAAIYESYLLSVVTKFMLDRLNTDPKKRKPLQ